MKRYSLNKNWLFHIEDEEYIKTKDPSKKDELTTFGFFKAGEANGFASRIYPNAAWEKVDLPHDYVLELPHDLQSRGRNGLKPVNDSQYCEKLSPCGRTDSDGFSVVWYRKEFFLTEIGDVIEDHRCCFGTCDVPAPKGKRYFLQLDGVYRDYTVWINGVYIDRYLCGYLGTVTDITDQLLFGETNSIAIRVDCSQYDGWWYDGGGIYRDVFLLESQDVYCHKDDIYIQSFSDGKVKVKADIHNNGDESSAAIELIIKDDLRTVWKNESMIYLDGNVTRFNAIAELSDFKLWDVDSPNLYTLELYINNRLEQSIRFGFKDITFDSQEGFFLNGRSLKIQGLCIHQDFPAVGVAMTKEMIAHRLKKLKDMGANAIRTVHNPHSEYTLELCDELGILVMDETRLFGSSPEALLQLEKLVKRDRNHVSVFIWSLGNEEHTVQSNEWGARMARSAIKLIKKHCADAVISFGGNNGRHYEGVNSQLELRGINYIRISNKFHPDDYHNDHPKQALFCSEESSVVSTRGCYKTDTIKGFVDSYGHNCAPWGSSPMGYMKYCMERPWFCGGFLWTGYDYRGEPAPFGEIGNRFPMGNFGIMDLCGFPKDIYYYYRAHWKNEPLLHLLPSWDREEGEEVKVYAFTNCDEVNLYLNDELISTQRVEKYSVPQWKIKFVPGELKAIGQKGDLRICDVKRSTKTQKLGITLEECGDYTLATIEALDEYSNTVNSDNSIIEIKCKNAAVIGAANGDPTLMSKERFRPEKDLLKLPNLTGCRSLPKQQAPIITQAFDAKSERFEDEFRILWRQESAKEEDYNFSCDFTTEDDRSYIEFSGILGESTVLLDGKAIGSTPRSNGIVHKRPYRFYCDIRRGAHTLSVKMKLSENDPCALEDAFAGRLTEPNISYPLFNGKMLLLLKNSNNGTASLYVSDKKGHNSEILL